MNKYKHNTTHPFTGAAPLFKKGGGRESATPAAKPPMTPAQKVAVRLKTEKKK